MCACYADLASAENERLVEDLQEKLEEARAEITQRRKDEKEMKSKERTLLIQIAGVSRFMSFDIFVAWC
jgi:phage terminase Nu1 subunit (DNA packaging protein)